MILNSPDAFPHRKTQWNTNAGTIRKFNQIAVNITKYNQIEVVIFLFFVISTRQAAFQPLSSSAFAADSSWRPRSLATNLCRNTDFAVPSPSHTQTHQYTPKSWGGRPPNPNPPILPIPPIQVSGGFAPNRPKYHATFVAPRPPQAPWSQIAN